jgi:PTS system nitrogen regulatory IIA component
MKVLDYLEVDSICVDLNARKKSEAIEELCKILQSQKKIKVAKPLVDALLQREKLGSTGIGQGIAIPHAKSDTLDSVVAALGISKKGLDFEALDGEPVHIVFLLVAPPDSAGLHLKILARISRLLKDKFFRQSLREAKTVEDVKKIISVEDQY